MKTSTQQWSSWGDRSAVTHNSVAIRLQFDQISGLANLPTLIALIPVMNWIGKSVLRKRGLAIPSRFIGWTLFWQGAGLALLLGLCSTLIFALPIAFLILRSKSAGMLIVPLLAILIPVSAMFSYGWATLRASRLAAPEAGT